jgi:hypothetical protein
VATDRDSEEKLKQQRETRDEGESMTFISSLSSTAKDGGHDPETDIPSRHQEPNPDVPEPDDETQDLVRPIQT